MPVWKVLIIGVLACASFGLAISTFLAPLVATGGERWAWMGGLLVATICVTGVFVLFMRSASGSLDKKTRGVRY